MEEYQHLINIQQLKWRDFEMKVYEYLEQNKDAVCYYYKISFYNPTVLTRQFIKYLKRNQLKPLMFENGEPCGLDGFMLEENA